MAKLVSDGLPAPVTEVAPAAVLIELDALAFPGRRLEFSALQEVLADQSRSLTPTLFARYALEWPPSLYLDPLLKALGRGRILRERALRQIEEVRRRALCGPSPQIHEVFLKLIERCRQRKVGLGWLTRSDEETARRVASACGLKDEDLALHVFQPSRRLVKGQETWLPLATRLHVLPSRCLVLTSGRLLCLAAISVSMRCVACPDEFTASDNFVGADEVLDRWDEQGLRRVIELLEGGR